MKQKIMATGKTNVIGGPLMDLSVRAQCALVRLRTRLSGSLHDERGQATTEYAILVGVLVVIAILAIALFRPKLQELWNAIAEGINSL